MVTLSDIAAGFGRGVLALGTGGISELARSQAEQRKQEQQQHLQSLVNIASGQNIPAFRRAELQEQGLPIQQEIQRNLQSAAMVNPLTASQALSQITKQAFPKPVDPIKLGAGETLVSPTGEAIFRAPEKAKDIAQTKKFELEARKLEKEIARGGVDPEKIFSNTQGLRKEFLDQSSEFIKQRDAIERVNASAEDPSPAGDLALIFNYMKILDPASVVRESEFVLAAQAGSYGDKIQAQVGRVLSGERLNPDMRADFVKRAGKLFNRIGS